MFACIVPVRLICCIFFSDKQTANDLPSDHKTFEVEQVLSLIISYLGGKDTMLYQKLFIVGIDWQNKYTILYQNSDFSMQRIKSFVE